LEAKATENEEHARMLYQELFHLNPIRFNLTFTAIKQDEGYEQPSYHSYTHSLSPNTLLSLRLSIVYIYIYLLINNNMSIVSVSFRRNNLARILLAIPDKLLPNVENAPITLNGKCACVRRFVFCSSFLFFAILYVHVQRLY
jgi:hypothetical protein